MMTSSITLERLRELLDAYGAQPERWPDAERAAAQALIGRSAAARALWKEAREVDLLLGAVSVEPEPALVTRVLAAAPRRAAPRRSRRALTAAVPLAAAAVLALWIAVARERGGRAPTTPVLVGVYFGPTDVLLEQFGLDAGDPGLGIDLDEQPAPRSDTTMSGGPLG